MALICDIMITEEEKISDHIITQIYNKGSVFLKFKRLLTFKGYLFCLRFKKLIDLINL